MKETERGRDTKAEGEAAPCRKPDMGLHHRPLGSRPEPKAEAQLLSCPGILS